MLILAGVSINAVVGDNGIISKAQDATIMQSIAALEEFLQTEYASYTIDNNSIDTTPYQVLKSKHPDWFFKNNQGYVPDAYSHALYLIDMNALAEEVPEIGNSVRGGRVTSTADYYGQKDVYGVTSDLKVYYCKNGVDTILGVTVDELEMDNPLKEAYEAGSGLATLITGRDDKGVTNQQLKSVTTMTFDSTTDPETIREFLKEAKNFVNLSTVTFKDISLDSLTGLENIEVLNVQNCIIGDYSALANSTKIKSIYLINQTDEQAQKFMENLSNAELDTLEYLGMYRLSGTNYITNIDKLENWNKNTLDNIKYIYLYAENITNISALANCTALEYLDVHSNTNLTTLVGIDNITTLKSLYAYNCNLMNLPAFTMGSELEYASVYNNKTLASLAGLENCTNLKEVYAYSCNLTNIEALNNKLLLSYVNLQNNSNLVNVSALKNDTAIKTLYLSGNNNMSIDDVKAIKNVILACGKDYSIPTKYAQYLVGLTSYDLRNMGLTDYSNEINNLKNGTQIYRLGLDGNTGLAKSKLAKLIHDGKLSVDELDKIKENLTLTTAQTTLIDTLKSYTNEQIRDMSDTQINGLEISDSDIYFRYVLSTMEGMQYLSLVNINGLTSFDWTNKVKGLKGLDLYGTSIKDLSLAEDNCLQLGDLRINNPNIDLTKMQKTISRCTTPYPSSFLTTKSTTYLDATGFNNIGAGFIAYGDALLNQLNDCKEITSLYMWSHGGAMSSNNYTLNLTGCDSLESFTMCRYVKGIIKISPATKNVTLEDTGMCKLDVSEASSVQTINLNAFSFDDENLNDISSYLAGFDILENFQLRFWNPKANTNYNQWIDNFKNCTKLKTFTTKVYSGFNPNYGDCSAITMPASLTSLNLTGMKITEMPDISRCTGLNKLEIGNNLLDDLDFCEGLNELTTIEANDNKITSIYSIKDLRKLERLNLENNFLYDYSYKDIDGATRGINNLVMFTEFKNSGLKELYIKGNYFDDMSPLTGVTFEESSGIE